MGARRTVADLADEFPDGQLDTDGNEVDAENERCRLAARRERPLSRLSSEVVGQQGESQLVEMLDVPLFDV